MSLGSLLPKGDLLLQLDSVLLELRVGEADGNRRVHRGSNDLLLEAFVPLDAELRAVPRMREAHESLGGLV